MEAQLWRTAKSERYAAEKSLRNRMQEKTLEYYMSLPYTVEIRHNQDGYFAKILELPGCMTWAETFEELEPMIEGAMEVWIGCGLEHGDPIPEPSSRADS